ncbi:MAG: diadenylate cyclase CdaA [Defluviitaleaceae bacterium]|nr:diadenylate cyclase CdaA [Defluviitaleaceae bacterium]
MFYAFLDGLVDWTNIPVLTFPQLGPAQVLDILIIAGILYLVLRWIKRTHAWVLIRGIALVLFLRFVAIVFDLVTLGWLLEHAFTVGLIALVVLFQPELRKVLEQMGKGQYLASFKIDSGEHKVFASDETIEEIVKAAKEMGKVEKGKAPTGALIVIEQSIDLSEQIQSGLAIDAAVSSQLLLNVFEKNTPLHDGAVFIRNNRLAAAKCILPLTAESVDSALGTRHRAAIGITEVSDARVVVVSEETGTMSVAIDGKLTRNVNEAQMRDMLMFGAPVKSSRFSFFRSKSGKKGGKGK